MVACRRGEEAHAADHRAALLVDGAEIEPADAREGDGAGAHRTWLQRDVEVGFAEPLGCELCRSLADHQHLGMGGRIGEFAGAVAGAGDDLAGADDDGADRHFAARGGGLGLGERCAHEIGAAGIQLYFLASPKRS